MAQQISRRGGEDGARIDERPGDLGSSCIGIPFPHSAEQGSRVHATAELGNPYCRTARRVPESAAAHSDHRDLLEFAL
jgi:hypothetical protein